VCLHCSWGGGDDFARVFFSSVSMLTNHKIKDVELV
jgi:hypothetical protein